MMGSFDIKKLLMGLGFLIVLSIIVWMVMAWLYAWVSKKVILHFNLEPLTVKEMWETYLLILVAHQILSFVVMSALTFVLNFVMKGVDANNTFTVVIISLYYFIVICVGVFILAWLISLWLKDAYGQPFTFKIALIMGAIISVLHTILLFTIMTFPGIWHF